MTKQKACKHLMNHKKCKSKTSNCNNDNHSTKNNNNGEGMTFAKKIKTIMTTISTQEDALATDVGAIATIQTATRIKQK